MKKNLLKNLYVFEPYRWSFCGGAILVIAETFDQAVDLAKESEKDKIDPQYEGIFSKSKQELEEYDPGWDRWLLSYPSLFSQLNPEIKSR